VAQYSSNVAFGALLVALMVALGFALSHFLLRRTFRRSLDRRQLATERQFAALTAEIRALEARLNEQAEIAELQAAAAPEFTMEVAQELATAPETAIEPEMHPQQGSELSPETMTVLTAAVTAFLGRKVRILSARLLESPNEMASAWSQQGRVFVQASHNLRARG